MNKKIIDGKDINAGKANSIGNTINPSLAGPAPGQIMRANKNALNILRFVESHDLAFM